MLQISAELLSMSGDAALLITNGNISYANTAALELLGHDCVGKSMQSVLGADVAEIQAPSYVKDALLDDKRYLLRIHSVNGVKAVFISNRLDEDAVINEAFIYALRSSLMNISISLSLLRENREIYPQMRDTLAVLNHDCFKINRILSNISVIQSRNSGSQLFSPIHMDITDFIAELCDSLNLLGHGAKIRFEYKEPIYLYADPNLLECLILNLISNCRQHAEGCTRISVNLIQAKESVIIGIDDDGCGIPTNELHSVFDRYRHKYDISNMSSGAGLGLTAVRVIAAKHHGTVLMESREGLGTAVRVSLSTNPYSKRNMKQDGESYEKNMHNLLTGLADCLPSEYFTEQYSD